jgi:Skp family chaperone for outer membrane proteins
MSKMNWARKDITTSRQLTDGPVIGAGTFHATAYDQAIIDKLEAERAAELNALQVARNQLEAEGRNLKDERWRLEKERARHRRANRKRKREARKAGRRLDNKGKYFK